jgi:hypothetical protein
MRATSTLLLLLLLLSTPATANPTRGGPAPERVYRHLRQVPAILTREEALEFLSEATPDALWRSSKLSVDARIKDLLSQPGFDSLDEQLQSQIHASMLEIRSSFWAEDPAELASAGAALREVWEGGSIVAEPEGRESAEECQQLLLLLVEEVEMAVAFQSCARAEPELGTSPYLDCLLSGGPVD